MALKEFGNYLVSDTGVVISKERTSKNVLTGGVSIHKQKVLTPIEHNNGYLNVDIYNNGQRKRYSIHKLVAILFIPRVDGKEHINHIDGNKHNNNVSNLEWCTASENIKHAYDTGLRKPPMHSKGKTGANAYRSIKVKCITTGVIYDSGKQAAESNNISRSILSNCLNGKVKKAGGLEWQFLS